MAKSPTKSTPGPPTDLTPELGRRICIALMEPKSLRKICAAADMPNRSTVFEWLAKGDAGIEPYVAFRAQYEAAREVQADALADEIVDIADTPQLGEKRTTKGTGADATVEVVEADMIEHRKLQISVRQWNAEKLRPKKYGAKVDVNGSLGVVVNIKRFSATAADGD